MSSVKFQETTQTKVTEGATAAGAAAVGAAGSARESLKDAAKAAHEKREELTHRIGEYLTGGDTGQGYLAAYLKQLQTNPLRTKMLTSGALAGLQEVLASWLAHDRSKHGHYFSSRVPKMMAYGALISAPLGHALIGILQWLFSNRSSLKAKIMQILVSNLVISPIQNTVYLASMAVIAGARTFHQIRATVRAGFMPVMKVSWITSPIALAFAQKFLPEYLWVPFFNFVAFVIGTYINTHTKKKRLAALRKKHYGESGRASVGPPRPSEPGYPRPSEAGYPRPGEAGYPRPSEPGY